MFSYITSFLSTGHPAKDTTCASTSGTAGVMQQQHPLLPAEADLQLHPDPANAPGSQEPEELDIERKDACPEQHPPQAEGNEEENPAEALTEEWVVLTTSSVQLENEDASENPTSSHAQVVNLRSSSSLPSSSSSSSAVAPLRSKTKKSTLASSTSSSTLSSPSKQHRVASPQPEIDIPPSITSTTTTTTALSSSSSPTTHNSTATSTNATASSNTDTAIDASSSTNHTQMPQISRRKLKVLRNRYLNILTANPSSSFDHLFSHSSSSSSSNPTSTSMNSFIAAPSSLVGNTSLAAFLKYASQDPASQILKELKNRELKLKKLSKLGMRAGTVCRDMNEGFTLGNAAPSYCATASSK